MADVAVVPTAVASSGAGTTRKARSTPASYAMRTVAVLYVSALVLLPLVVLAYRTCQPGLSQFLSTLSNPYSQHAFRVSAIITVCALVINTVFGTGLALLMSRHRFPGKRLISAFVDLPTAVSPIVVGLALLLVFSPGGWLGFFQGAGIQVIGAYTGMVLATVFVSLPLVLRAVLPVLEQVGTDQEVAAESLGASALVRFRRITLPTIRAALTYGVVLSFARCMGEYGAVLIVSNNISGVTETVPQRIDNVIVQSQDYNGAYALASVLVLISLAAIGLAALIRRRQAS